MPSRDLFALQQEVLKAFGLDVLGGVVSIDFHIESNQWPTVTVVSEVYDEHAKQLSEVVKKYKLVDNDG